MTPRTLRCANARLYAGFTLLVLAAAAYAVMGKKAEGLQLWGAVAACAACSLWGGYYITLKYVADASGVVRSVFGFQRQRLLWSNLTKAEIRETDSPGVSSCAIILVAGQETMRLSSDLLPLDGVRELAADMRSAGLIPVQPARQASAK